MKRVVVTRYSALAMTLIELLVVLAVIGLVLGISLPGLIAYSEQAHFKAATRQVMGVLSLARQMAISSRKAYAVSVDVAGREVVVTELNSGDVQDQRVKLPTSVSVEVLVGGEPAEEPRLVFRPTGSLAGRTTAFVLTGKNRQQTITVSAVTGTVLVQ